MEYDSRHAACHSSDPDLDFSNALHARESWHVSQAAVYVARIRHAATSRVEDNNNYMCCTKRNKLLSQE